MSWVGNGSSYQRVAEVLDRLADPEAVGVGVGPGGVEHQRHVVADRLPDRRARLDVEADRGHRVAREPRAARRVQLVALPALLLPVAGLVRVLGRASGGGRWRSRRGCGPGRCRAAGAPAGPRPCPRCPTGRRRPCRPRAATGSGRGSPSAASACRCRAGRSPSSHGLTTLTICSAICAGPGPGLDRKALPSMPSSVWIRSTPRGTGPAGPKLAEAVCLRSCRTTVISVMRTTPDVTRLAAERQGPGGARSAVVSPGRPTAASSARRWCSPACR